MPDPEGGHHDPEGGYRRLLAGMLVAAYDDAAGPWPDVREDALAWTRGIGAGIDFEATCHAVNLDPAEVAAKLDRATPRRPHGQRNCRIPKRPSYMRAIPALDA